MPTFTSNTACTTVPKLICEAFALPNGNSWSTSPTLVDVNYTGFSWDTCERTIVRELGGTADCYCEDLKFHPDGFLIAVSSGTPGTGKLQFIDFEVEEPLWMVSNLSNCHAIDVHPDGKTIAVTTTVRGSNGNGRKVDAEGNYIGNTSPIQILVPDRPTNQVPTP